jgi:hypothetical protein
LDQKLVPKLRLKAHARANLMQTVLKPLDGGWFAHENSAVRPGAFFGVPATLQRFNFCQHLLRSVDDPNEHKHLLKL